jgi:hypothetical protein
VEGRLAGVENGNLAACVVSLAGSHHAGAAAAENDYVNFLVPFGGKAGCGSRGGKGGSSSGDAGEGGCAHKGTTGNICHDLFSFHLDLEFVAVIAFEMRLGFYAVAVRAVRFTTVRGVRIRRHFFRFCGNGVIGLMAHQAVFHLSIVRKGGVHRSVLKLSLSGKADRSCEDRNGSYFEVMRNLHFVLLIGNLFFGPTGQAATEKILGRTNGGSYRELFYPRARS